MTKRQLPVENVVRNVGSVGEERIVRRREDMSDHVNAEVVETREQRRQEFREFWAVRHLCGASQRISWEFDSLEDAQSFARNHLKQSTKYQILHIPAEGEVPTKREPATEDAMFQLYRDLAIPATTNTIEAWRAAERHHGIGASDERRP